MGITHSTPADGTFSPDGSNAWNDEHVLAESGGQALTVGAISNGQYLQRSGTAIVGAAGTSVSTPTYPGGIPLTGVSYPAVRGYNLSTGDTDLYTVPAGKRLFLFTAAVYNPSLGNITHFAQAKIGATYYRLNANTITATVAGTAYTNIGYIFEAGEIVAMNTATTNGLNVSFQAVQFDDSCALKSAKITTISAGANTIYTCPGSTTAILFPRSLQLGAAVGTGHLSNTSGGTRTLSFNVVPSGGVVGSGNQTTPSFTANDLTVGAGGLGTSLGAGDFVNINVDAGTATQMAWVNVMEIT